MWFERSFYIIFFGLGMLLGCAQSTEMNFKQNPSEIKGSKQLESYYSGIVGSDSENKEKIIKKLQRDGFVCKTLKAGNGKIRNTICEIQFCGGYNFWLMSNSLVKLLVDINSQIIKPGSGVSFSPRDRISYMIITARCGE